MKSARRLSSYLTINLLLVIGFIHPVAESKASDRAIVANLVDDYKRLVLRPVTLDFASFLQALPSKKDQQQTFLIQDLERQIDQLVNRQQTLSFCDNQSIDNIRFNVELAKERARLASMKFSQEVSYNGRFNEMPSGKAWYLHWLKSWLHSDIGINELKHFAYQELADVKDKRKLLASQQLPTNTTRFHADEHNAIVTAFKERERIVNKHLARVFGTNFIASPINITPSTLPKSFPAPGIYDGINQKFIYHLQGDYLAHKHMDWLFLHEAVPGHHFQSRFVGERAICSNVIATNSTVFSEGWGAYVETLGQQLGLFQDKDSFNYALDWQALRAVRVLIDIGIHYEGWSDQRARALWQTYIPEQRAIMDREIKRIKRWPVQVITYVFGKQKIIRSIKSWQQQEPKQPLQSIHHKVLGLSNLSLSSLTKVSNLDIKPQGDMRLQ